jgi:transcriptional regulator with XRE-family HTH domain
MSQGDIERKTGLLRWYISRVENSHTIPAIESLEKMARAMEIELYQLFFESNGHKKPQDLNLPVCPAAKLSRKDAGIVSQLGGLVPRMNDRDKRIVVNLSSQWSLSEARLDCPTDHDMLATTSVEDKWYVWLWI